MPQKVLKFTGINRRVNEFQGSGTCEELINLRPTAAGYEVVRCKEVLLDDVEYDLFLEHVWGAYNNQIVIDDGIVSWRNSPSGPKTITSEFERKKVSLSFAGNVLVIYCEEDKKQLVFKFDEGEYVRYDVSIKPITDIRVAYDYLSTFPASYSVSVDANNETGYEEALAKAASGFYTAHPHGLCGAAIVGCEYELVDGNKLWSTAFTVANVTEHEEYKAPTLDVDNKRVLVNGVKDVRLHLTFGNVESGDIRRINVYATRPVFPYDVVRDGDGLNAKYQVKKVSLDDVNLAGQIMYYQGSVSPNNTSADLLLSFGKEQAGEAIMDVNAGCIERSGNAVSYNNRFHFFKSEVNHVVQKPTTSATSNISEASEWVAYVLLSDSWILVNHKYRFSESVKQDFIYPMAGVKKLRFVRATEDTRGNWSVPYEEHFDVDLKDSSAYNYSYAFGVIPSVVQINDAWYDVIAEHGQIWSYAEANGFTEKVMLEKETNEINVSAPFNPYVFPVNYSYSFGGEIIDIATSYLPISSTQIGQYPITVFTTSGIYAMEQGSGQVLYGNIVPLQPHVIDGKAEATPYGTFFISSKNLYLLSGREAVNVSGVLQGDRELNLVENESYRALCLNEGKSKLLYDYRYALSDDDEDFDVIVSGSRLIYDQYRNELFICSDYNNLRYSYVFNLDTKAYHKVTKKYIAYQNNSRYVIEIDGDTRNVVDLFDEIRSTDKPVLLQSRPFSLEEFYSHIHRLIMKTDAELSGEQHLILSVFASDNLYDWKCIISAQKMNTVLRQIRTNRAPKSYKDYVILITGRVNTDTDISDIIADYTVVNRRLG
jgi:hypothetical protein